MEYRIERDSMGEIKVPADKLWGAQTQRSFENFKIGTEKIPAEMVTVFAYLKKAAALTNRNWASSTATGPTLSSKPAMTSWPANSMAISPWPYG